MGSSSNASSNHAKILSQTVLFLRDSLEKMNAETSSAFNSSIHSTPSADEDIMTMSKVILESGMCGVEEGRKLFAPTVDPREKCLEKIENVAIEVHKKGSRRVSGRGSGNSATVELSYYIRHLL